MSPSMPSRPVPLRPVMGRPILLLLSALLALAFGCSSEQPVVRVAEKLAFEPGKLEYGEIFISAGFTKTLLVRNSGATAVGLTLIDPLADFEVNPDFAKIPANGEVEFRVRFQPTSVGPVAKNLRFRTSGNNVHELPVRANGVPGSMEVVPGSVQFGEVPRGEKRTVNLTVRSRTDGDLTLHISLRGSTDFSTDEGTALLGGRTEIPLQVSFEPQSGDPAGGWLDLYPCQGCTRLSVPLEGRGQFALLEAFPKTVEFGRAHPPLVATTTVEIRNSGTLAAELAAPSISGDGDESFFTILDLDSFPEKIEAKSSIEIRLAFASEELGHRSVELLLHDKHGELLLGIPMRAESGGPLLTWQEVDFGPVPAGLETRISSEIRNDGASGTPKILSAVIEGPGADVFRIDGKAVFPAGVGTTPVEIGVFFLPPDEGKAYEAEMVVQTDSIHQPVLRIPLRGRAPLAGCELEFASEELRFGLVGKPGRERSVKLVHTGEGECFIWGLILDDPASAFRLTEAEPQKIRELVKDEPLQIGVGLRSDIGDGWLRAELEVRHSREDAEPLGLPVSAYRAPSLSLNVQPASLIFPETLQGAFTVKQLSIQLSVTQQVTPKFSNPNFRMGRGGNFFAGPAGWPVDLIFQPQEPGRHEGVFEIWLSGFPEGYLVDLQGTAFETCSEPCDWPSLNCSAPATVAIRESWSYSFGYSGGPATCTMESYETPPSGGPFFRTSPGCGDTLGQLYFLPGFFRAVGAAEDGLGRGATCEIEIEIVDPTGG